MGNEWRSLLFETCLEGVSSAVSPELLPDNQLAWGFNISVRGGKPLTRPALKFCMSLAPGLIQGGSYFGIQGGMIVTQIAGQLYRLRIGETAFSYENIPLDFDNSGIIEQVWMQQTVESLIIQDGQSDPIIYNGSVAVRSDPGDNEVPRGRQMAYGNGRLWVAVNQTEVLAGDIRTNTAGSELLFTEATYLSGGGRILFPEAITGMSFIPVTGTTDYGALLVFGSDYTHSIRADITQRDLWATYPGFVSNVLRNIGCAGQWSISQVNQDLYWRDSVGGIRSLRSSLADESGPGNSPISREVSRLVDYDSPSLLPLCSSINFDNRLLMTSSPYLHLNGGVAWKDLVSLDFSPVSTMRGKSFPSYNGTWRGLKFVQLLTGKFNNIPRAFALASDDDGNNQLWEIDTSIRTNRDDVYPVCSNGSGGTDEQPIVSFIEYQRRDFGLPKNRKRLERCDVWLSDITGNVDLTVYWRTDNNQQWNEWDAVEVCAKTTDDSTDSPHVWKNLLNQQRPQIKTFTIPDGTDPITDYGKQTGYNFQIRLKWTGRCKIDRMMLHATVLPDPDYANREEMVSTCLENNVEQNEIDYAIPSEDGCAQIEVEISDGTGTQPVYNESTVPISNIAFEESRDLEFTIVNPGSGTLHLSNFTVTPIAGDFEILTEPAENVEAGGTTTFSIRFTASAVGTNSAVVSMDTNVDGSNPFTFTLEAEIAAPVVNGQVMVVAAGGGGGSVYAGGGGGGEVYYNSSYPLDPLSSYTVTIGTGGAGAPDRNSKGTNGGDSAFGAITAAGGGGGGSLSTGAAGTMNGLPGGSGGGGAGGGSVAGPGNSGIGGAGTAGGTGGDGETNGTSEAAGGGGGGAGVNGQTAPDYNNGGNGGDGVAVSIGGSSLYYGGGGGGGASGPFGPNTPGAGGNGGGAAGSLGQGGDAIANRGGGGGGSGWGGADQRGGNGGSGIVAVRYTGSPQWTGGTVSSVGGDTLHTFTTSGVLAPI